METLRRIWNALNRNANIWTATWIIIVLLIGIWAIYIYKSYYPLAFGSACLWAFAYFVTGGVAGFIFGVPTVLTNNAPSTTTTSNTVQSASVINQPSQAVNSQQKIIQDNTNLTEISNWLTKVIIGAGLVELKEIPKFVMHVARIMGAGIAKNQNFIEQSTILSAAIIIFFTAWGLVSGYLTMRLIIARLLVDD